MTTTIDAPAPARTLEYLPVALFGSAMGLAGLGIAWHIAASRYGVPVWIARSIDVVALLSFVAGSVGYVVKCIAAPDVVAAEFCHPISGNLFGTVLISLLLLPIVVAPVSLPVARASWVVGAIGMVVFAWFVVGRWLRERQQVAHAVPAWFVPVVGMLDVPLALPSLALPPMPGVMVLSLAVGLFFAVPLFTLIFSRLLFEAPLPDALQPSLIILLAPFAVGTSTYIVTAGRIDLFALSLYALMLFLYAVLAGRMRHLAHCCPFRVSWWAVGFPLAAAAIAALRTATAMQDLVTDAIAWTLLGVASAVIAWLTLRTLAGIARGELRTLTA